jgi:hypothetical protein
VCMSFLLNVIAKIHPTTVEPLYKGYAWTVDKMPRH